MVKLSKKDIFNELKSYIIISLGLVVYAFAWICILAPAQVVGGGASGIALIILDGLTISPLPDNYLKYFL